MLKKTYVILTSVLTCLTLSVSAFASASEGSEVITAAENSEATAVSQANEGELISPPYDPDDSPLPQTAAEETWNGEDMDMVVPAEDAVEPVEPISPPAANETAPSDDSGFPSNYYTGTGDIEDIYEYWEANGYPDDVSYVEDHSVAEYHLATQTEIIHRIWNIGVVNADEARKQEICALISPEYRISFTDCEYSHSCRVQVKEEIERIFPQATVELGGSQEVWVYLDNYTDEEASDIEHEIGQKYSELIIFIRSVPAVGLPETAAADAIGVEPPATEAAPGNILTEIGVDVTAAASNSDNFVSDPKPEENSNNTAANSAEKNSAPTVGIDSATAQNGTAAETIPAFTGKESGEVAAVINESGKSESVSLWIWLCSVAAAIAVIAAAVVIGRAKRSNALSLADGGEVSVGGKAGRAEVVKAVRESETEPSEAVFNGIMEKINNEK